MRTLGLRDHLTGAVALAIAGFLVVMGCPGISALEPGMSRRPGFRQRVTRKAGPVAAEVAVGLARVNELVRVPISARLRRVERVFRIRQGWHLYSNGPRRVKRLGDPALDWNGVQFGHRRVRPMLETLASRDKAAIWEGCGAWIVDRARADFPEAGSVTIRAVFRPWEADPADTHVVHGRVARAPGWVLEPLPVDAP
jgi:hypothetical protein